jgi:hypothetical protein
MDLCEHLQPILEFLESSHGLRVKDRVSGRSWGLAALMSGSLPYDDIRNRVPIPDCVAVSPEHHMISCGQCWTNIAEYSVYAGNWP